ncbi:GGDEF domain-containing protein [Stenotrophomonas maltophilia]|uniref:GGDEF domain-containing protein n=1 Tax=Stenotrophomonas maltophilia TaxID=40324 RepID=A0ABD7BZI4_STEMA|nr:GGDEF domain-containing protein [Stenotrophomonas maltophilia]QQQ40977.1 GGDEF domain-containing protein [Stenotrophomonas maltophilia]
MRAGWLDDFRFSLVSEIGGQAMVKVVRLLHKTDNSWFNAATQVGVDKHLDASLSASGWLRKEKSQVFSLGFPAAEVVVEVEFLGTTRSNTRDKLKKTISQIAQNARHRYDALHDSLTGCRNRASFDESVRDAIRHAHSSAQRDGDQLTGGGKSAVAFVSVDIDFFKKINDGRGHDYGDTVLRAFSWELEEACTRAESQWPGSSVSVFRLGGEEFGILISGGLGEQELVPLVDGVRASIAQSTLPSERHLRAFRLADQRVPPANERRVTASFGISRISFTGESLDDKAAINFLKIQADKALYSAKNSGRNCTRYFPDILKKYGRVIEYDRRVGVVVIDIGIEAGVEKGREFFVVPESYSGERPYVVDDGRSRRTLGVFPRIRVAKIAAFDVQSEISFCFVAEVNSGVDISAGDFLESIPLGLFGGLSSLHASREIGNDGHASDVIAGWVAGHDADQVRVAAIRFEGIRKVEREFGALRANEILAGSVAAAKKVFPAPAKIAQGEVGQLGIAFVCRNEDLDGHMIAFVEKLHEICSDSVRFNVGLFNGSLVSGDSSGFALEVGYGFDYATIAAAMPPSGAGWSAFDASFPRKVMSDYMRSERFDQMIADHSRFRSIGLVGGYLDNFAGIAYHSIRQFEPAIGMFRSAVERDSGRAIFYTNLAISLYATGKSLEAYDTIVVALDKNGGALPADNVKALFAVSALESFDARGIPDLEFIDDLFNAADVLEVKSFVDASVYSAMRERASMMLSEQSSA